MRPLKNNETKAKWINPSQNPEINNKWFFSDCSNCGYVADFETTICPNCNAEMINGDLEWDEKIKQIESL